MYPQSHFLLALLLGLGLMKQGILSWQLALVTAIIAVAIDIDHFLSFVYRHHDFSFKHAWDAAVIKHEKKERTIIHHPIGFVVLSLFIIATYFINITWFYVLAIAYFSHYLIDHIPYQQYSKKKRIKLLFLNFEVYSLELIFDVLLLIGIVLILL